MTGGLIVFVLAMPSFVVGSVLAVVQSNVKRTLACSSINHGVFILVVAETVSNRGGRARPGVVLLFALAGILFMVGFVAKLGVSLATAARSYGAPAVIAMISGFLYFCIIVMVFLLGRAAHGGEPVEFAGPMVLIPNSAAMSLARLGTLVLGVIPSPVERLTDQVVPEFFLVDGW